jgi:hypothetical protein
MSMRSLWNVQRRRRSFRLRTLSLHYLAYHRTTLAGSEITHQDDAMFLADDDEPLTIWSVSMLFKRLVKVIGTGSSTNEGDWHPVQSMVPCI